MTGTQSFRDGLPKNPQMDKNEMIKTNFFTKCFCGYWANKQYDSCPHMEYTWKSFQGQ